MDVYVVILEDRHLDVDVELFTSRDKAIERAKVLVIEYNRHPEDIKDVIIDGWEYCCQYSCEGDFVRVIKRGLK